MCESRPQQATACLCWLASRAAAAVSVLELGVKVPSLARGQLCLGAMLGCLLPAVRLFNRLFQTCASVSVLKSLQQVVASFPPSHPRPGCHTAVCPLGPNLPLLACVTHNLLAVRLSACHCICLLRMPCFHSGPILQHAYLPGVCSIIVCVGRSQDASCRWTAPRRCVACVLEARQPGPTRLIVVIAPRAERPHTLWWLGNPWAC